MQEPTVLEQFDAIAAGQPKKVAIFWGGERWSYGRLREQIDTCAGILHSQFGVRPSDRIGILLKNCPEFIVVLYGALKSGATVVPINTFLKPPEVQHIIDDCRIKLIVIDESFEDIATKLEGVRVVPLAAFAQRFTTSSPQFPT